MSIDDLKKHLEAEKRRYTELVFSTHNRLHAIGAKRFYLQQHVPRILAALIGNDEDAFCWTDDLWNRLRAQAIYQTSLLFDDIEALDLEPKPPEPVPVMIPCPASNCIKGRYIDPQTRVYHDCGICNGTGKIEADKCPVFRP